jgi:hypothetical protein
MENTEVCHAREVVWELNIILNSLDLQLSRNLCPG